MEAPCMIVRVEHRFSGAVNCDLLFVGFSR